MAFRHSYTGEDDPGRWFDVSHDPDRNEMVQFRIRRLPPDVTARLRRKYGKREGREYNVPNSRIPAFNRAMAISAWTDTKRCWISCETEESAKLYSQELGRSVKVGEEICIDGKLTDAIREDILSPDSGLIAFIVNTALSVESEEHREEADYEEHLLGNSESSSSSSSDPITYPRNDAEPVSSGEAKRPPASQTARS